MARVKVKETEKLTNDNIDYVISLLEGDNPISKKEACKILNISYNTARLNKIIENRKEEIRYEQEMYKKYKNKPLSDNDKQFIVKQYLLEGESISEIAKRLFRSYGTIKRFLEKIKVPLRSSSNDYFNPELIDDSLIKESYNKNDIVFSAKYNDIAEIRSLFKKDQNHGNVYSIWLFNRQHFALQPYYELADLSHLKEYLWLNTNF